MISAAFFVLLTLAVLSANKMILENTKYYLQEEAIEQASNFANALIGEILTKKFDSQVTTDGTGKVTGPYNRNNLPWPRYQSGMPRHFLTLQVRWVLQQQQKIMSCLGEIPMSCRTNRFRGDSPSWFDDVDDYKGYVRTANSADISGYTLTVNVYYVTKSNTSSAASFQTWWKRIDVSCDSSNLFDKALLHLAQ